jgi:hydrogenase nickel incorporation protein HypA/HybF
MHELGIAQSVVSTVLERMNEHGYTRVTEIGLRIGALTDIVPDALEFGFEVATRGTPLENTVLKIETVPITGHCTQCDQDFQVEHYVFVCPHCRGRDIEMSQGDELEFAYLDVEEINGQPAEGSQ